MHNAMMPSIAKIIAKSKRPINKSGFLRDNLMLIEMASVAFKSEKMINAIVKKVKYEII